MEELLALYDAASAGIAYAGLFAIAFAAATVLPAAVGGGAGGFAVRWLRALAPAGRCQHRQCPGIHGQLGAGPVDRPDQAAPMVSRQRPTLERARCWYRRYGR